MQRIQVHPDVLDEKARLVQQKKQELERMVRELEKSIYMLQSDWSGVTGERFFWDAGERSVPEHNRAVGPNPE